MNPRPEGFHQCVYMLISIFQFRPFSPDGAGNKKGYPELFLRHGLGNSLSSALFYFSPFSPTGKRKRSFTAYAASATSFALLQWALNGTPDPACSTGYSPSVEPIRPHCFHYNPFFLIFQLFKEEEQKITEFRECG